MQEQMNAEEIIEQFGNEDLKKFMEQANMHNMNPFLWKLGHEGKHNTARKLRAKARIQHRKNLRKRK